LPPLVATVGSQLFVWLMALLAGVDPLRLSSGLKWDALRYLDIARRGYEIFPCGDGPIDFPAPPPDAWCGNAGWFPLYPMMMRGLHALGVPYAPAGFLITQAALLGAFTVIWRLLGARLTESSAQCLVIAALLPGSIFQHLVFPISLALLAVAGTVAAVRARSWWAAGLCAAAGAAAYPSAALLCVLTPVAILVGWRHERIGRRTAQACGAGLIAGAGLFAVGLAFYLDTGHWAAYQLIQRNYGNGLHNPLDTMGEILAGGMTDAKAWSLLAILLVVGPAAYIGVRKGVRDGFDAELIMYLGLIVGLLLTPLVAGPRVSSYRSYALLGPVVVLLMGVPERLRLIVICACAGVANLLAFVYFRGNLI
jgi:hypothetical protein